VQRYEYTEIFGVFTDMDKLKSAYNTTLNKEDYRCTVKKYPEPPVAYLIMTIYK
jgi:hypothetical protein